MTRSQERHVTPRIPDRSGRSEVRPVIADDAIEHRSEMSGGDTEQPSGTGPVGNDPSPSKDVARRQNKRKRVTFQVPPATVIPEAQRDVLHRVTYDPTPDDDVDDVVEEDAGTRRFSRMRKRKGDSRASAAEEQGYHAEEYVIDHLVDHEYDAQGNLRFTIRWYGYSEEHDTCQPITDIPRSHIVTYCRRKKLTLPRSIEQALPG